jgi:hypothetical protein
MGKDEDDRRVTRRSNHECRDIARSIKAYYGIGRTWPVNIGRVLRSGRILTLRGEKRLLYDVVDDNLLDDKDAKTEAIDGAVKITAKKSVDFQASCGDGRARMTLAHELGHAVMHAAEGSIDHRATVHPVRPPSRNKTRQHPLSIKLRYLLPRSSLTTSARRKSRPRKKSQWSSL